MLIETKTDKNRAPLLLFLILSMSSCATPSLPQSTGSRADFQEKILEALASKKADEIIEQKRAEARLRLEKRARERIEQGEATGNFLDILGTIAGVTGSPWVSAGTQLFKKFDQGSKESSVQRDEAELREFLAWLDTRRILLKGKLLDLYTSRLKEAKDEEQAVFSVCVNGKERRYRYTPSTYLRLEDGPGPCQLTSISLSD